MSLAAVSLVILAVSLSFGVFAIHLLLEDRRERDEWADGLAARRPRRRSPFDSVEEWLGATRLGRELRRRLLTAGLSVRPGRVVVVAIVAGAGVFFGAGAVVPSWMALLVVVGVGRAALDWLEGRRRRRLVRLNEQLPEAAAAIAAVSEGRSTRWALHKAVGRLPEPAATEFGRLVARLELGWTLDDALEQLRVEMPSRELGLLLTTLTVTAAAGGDTKKALQAMGDALAADRQLKREVRTHLAGPITTARVVAVMGLAVPLLVNAVSHEALAALTGSTWGIGILLVAMGLYVAGIVLIRRIARTGI